MTDQPRDVSLNKSRERSSSIESVHKRSRTTKPGSPDGMTNLAEGFEGLSIHELAKQRSLIESRIERVSNFSTTTSSMRRQSNTISPAIMVLSELFENEELNKMAKSDINWLRRTNKIIRGFNCGIKDLKDLLLSLSLEIFNIEMRDTI